MCIFAYNCLQLAMFSPTCINYAIVRMGFYWLTAPKSKWHPQTEKVY